VSEEDRPSGILGRLTPEPPDRSAPASPVDVLLVDVDGEFRARVAKLLRRNAHTVVEVASPGEASAALRAGCAPRLLVVGVERPSSAERDALETLRADPACAESPLLLLCRTERDAPAALRPAATLLKPVEATELVDAVRRLCGSLAR
jgi:CheY-like chemotaxis protein